MATTTTLTGATLSHAKLVPKPYSPKSLSTLCMNHHQPRMANQFRSGRMSVRAMSSAPLSDQVKKSIKDAEETCAGDPVSGECAAAWDEVEEVSAAASDKRLKDKEADPLETFCKDNPETDECRTYDN